jgi:hypothetical protein
MRIGWLVNENHFERAMLLRNGSHLPTTQCACVDFAMQRNGSRGREKDLLHSLKNVAQIVDHMSSHFIVLIIAR